MRPPGPFGNLLFGNLSDLRTRVLDFFSSLREQYGDICTVRFSLRNVTYIQHPDYIHHVLQENNRNYTKSLRYEQLRYLLGNGLLTSEGEFWLRQRRMIQPAFHKEKLKLLTDEMAILTAKMCDRWETEFKGKKFNATAEMMALTLEIVGKTLLNANVRSEAAKMSASLSFLLRSVNKRTSTPVLLPLWIPLPEHLRIKKSVRTIKNILDTIFKDRREKPSERYDLLSMLMETRYEDTGAPMDDQQLRDEVMTIFVAGHETTANALSWTLYLLSLHPGELKKCKDEVQRVLGLRRPCFEDLHHLSYLTMAIEESMRIYPPAWIIGRKSIHKDKIGKYPIPAGHNILISAYALHRDNRYWPDPGKFIPGRFLSEEIKNRPKLSYPPFGGGPRLCIGNNFAMMEMQVVLSMILQKFDIINANEKEVLPDPVITLRPAGGVWLRI